MKLQELADRVDHEFSDMCWVAKSYSQKDLANDLRIINEKLPKKLDSFWSRIIWAFKYHG